MKKTLLTVSVAAAFFLVSGCLIGNEEYDETRRQRDERLAELQELRLENDILNQDISRAYAEVEELTSQAALRTALGLSGALLQDLASVAAASPEPPWRARRS